MELKRRLGHLDPRLMLEDPEAVRRAVQQPPKLHRYVENIPVWVVRAAGSVVHHYGGDAANIWNDRPTARALQRRFDESAGIGQKKAAMAVEILERNLDDSRVRQSWRGLDHILVTALHAHQPGVHKGAALPTYGSRLTSRRQRRQAMPVPPDPHVRHAVGPRTGDGILGADDYAPSPW